MDKENFLAGPHYSHEPHVQIPDSKCKEIEDFMLKHDFGARRLKIALENKNIHVSTTWLRDYRKANAIHVRFVCFRSSLICNRVLFVSSRVTHYASLR